MTAYKVVVDGSNVATEGRTRPSLSQLDEAVRSFLEEYPNADVIVIVDSSFPNRIDPSDVAVFEEAFLAGEIITPPAGTVGRGDAFILKVADKLGATVFSNDSFQEFHGTYDWLFEKGRLVGGKPIPGLGWVFTARVPVRGQKSREAVREAKRQTVRVGSPEAMRPMPVPKAPPPFLTKGRNDEGMESSDAFGDQDGRRRRKKRRGSRDGRDQRDGRDSRDGRTDVVVSFDEDSIDNIEAGSGQPDRADERLDAANNRRKRRQRGRTDGPEVAVAVNEPGTFLTFIASNLPGSIVEGMVDDYASHGFYVTAGGARCYVPLAGLAEPMPRSAKEVVRRGESKNFVVKAFDAVRRGIELALLGTPAAGDSVAIDATARDNVSKATKGGRAAKVPVDKAPAKQAAAKVTKSAKPAKSSTSKVDKSKPTGKATKPVVAELSTVDVSVASVAEKVAPSGTETKRSAKSTPVSKVAKKSAGVKAGGKSAAAKTPSTTKETAKTTLAAKVAPLKKPSAAKAAPAKKVPAKKVPAKKVPAEKPAAKAASARADASPAQNVAAKKPAAKTVPAKGLAPKAAPVKAVPAKKSSAKSAPVKKAAASKAPARKSAK